MRTVMFTFRSQVSPDRQEALLEEIGTWEEVTKAGRLKPDAKRADILRMAYAYVEDHADVAALVKRFAALPEVEDASMPAERHLLGRV